MVDDVDDDGEKRVSRASAGLDSEELVVNWDKLWNKLFWLNFGLSSNHVFVLCYLLIFSIYLI